MKSRITNLQIEIGQVLLPTVIKIGNKFAEMGNKLGKWIKENRQQFETIIKVIGKVGIVLIGFGGLSIALGTVTGFFGNLTLAVKGTVTAFTWLAAHPIVAGLLVIGGIALFVTKRLNEMSKGFDTSKNKEAMEALGKQRAKIIGDQFKKGQIAPLPIGLGKISAGEAVKKASELRSKFGADLNILNAEKLGKALVDAAMKTQKKITSNLDKEANKRIAKLKKERAEFLKTFKQIDIFAGKGGRILTEGVIAKQGFAAEALKKAMSGRKGNGKVFNISHLELSNVTNPESFVAELDKISFAMG